MTFGVTDVANMTWTINGNNIRNVDGNGILAVARGTNGALMVKIQNNDVEAPQGGSARASASMRATRPLAATTTSA